MRSQLLHYAALQQPSRPASSLLELADAINGDPLKGPNCTVAVPPSLAAGRRASRFASYPLPRAGAWFVSPSGSDGAAGSEAAPFKTVARAVAASRAAGGGGAIVLRAGTHYLAAPVQLGAADSGLVVQGYAGEEAWVSGAAGAPLPAAAWTPHNVSDTWALHPNTAIDVRCNKPHCVPLGAPANASACEALCLAALGDNCTAFSWHASAGHSHQPLCQARLDGVWAPQAQAGSTSGLRFRANVWRADLSGVDLRGGGVAGVRAGPALRRMVRARFPNADPELGFGPSVYADSWVPPPADALRPEIDWNPPWPAPNRSGESRNFGFYKEGLGGGCATLLGGLNPPTGYWCSNTSEQTGMWRTPLGMAVGAATLPHQPYADPRGAVVQAWHPKHWASRMYNVSDYSFAGGVGTFAFNRGGWQDARGSPDAGDLYVENVLEELDAPGEWFYDARTASLLLYWNGTGGPDGSVVVVASPAQVLFNATGDQAAPVRNVAFLGLGFRDTAHTYFEPHSMPSAGDWALARTAALIFEGTEGINVSGCVFERLDGHAVLISGYARNASVADNEMAWLGASGVVLWGRTTGDPLGVDGWDATSGDQPRYTVVARNFVHEVGIWQKQSSLLFQAKTSDSLVEGNIFFNGPRAAINQNDGMAGGNVVTRNVLLNTCRESGDHGPLCVPRCAPAAAPTSTRPPPP